MRAACAHCGAVLDAHDCVTDPDAEPRAGDATLCVECGGLSVWVSRGELRKPTPEELDCLTRHASVQAAYFALAVSGGNPVAAVAVARHVTARRN